MELHADITGTWSDRNVPGEYVFKTIQEAYDSLSVFQRKGLIDGPSVILVHAGDYQLTKPLHFTLDIPVEIRPYGQDRVTVSGGVPLKGWTKTRLNGRSVWKTVLPDTVMEVPFLFVDGRLATAARWPKQGFFRVEDERGGFQTDDDSCDNFLVRKGDFDPKWHDPENITVKMIHLWIEESLKIKSFDEKTGRLTTASAMRYVAEKRGTEYAFHNVREALSEPGEYYFDRQKHELFLIPEENDFEAVIPACGTLVRIDSGAKWITLSG